MITLQEKIIAHIDNQDKNIKFFNFDSSMKIAGTIPIHSFNTNLKILKKDVYSKLEDIKVFTTPFIFIADVQKEEKDHFVINILKVVNIEDFVSSHGNEILIENFDFSNFKFNNANFKDTNFKNVNLSNCFLNDSNFEKCSIEYCNFSGSTMIRSCLKDAYVYNSDFSRCDMSHGDLRNSTFIKTNLRNTEVWSAFMWNVDLKEAFTEGLNIARGDIRGG